MSKKFYFLLGLICAYIGIVLTLTLIFRLAIIDTKEKPVAADESYFFLQPNEDDFLLEGE